MGWPENLVFVTSPGTLRMSIQAMNKNDIDLSITIRGVYF